MSIESPKPRNPYLEKRHGVIEIDGHIYFPQAVLSRPPTEPLTPAECNTLLEIVEFQAEAGYFPTIKVLAELNQRATSTIKHRLRRLHEKGWIEIGKKGTHQVIATVYLSYPESQFLLDQNEAEESQ